MLEYNHAGIRFRKREQSGVVAGTTTNYYLDGSKILGEDRVHPNRDTVRLRYVYDATGLVGIRRRVGNSSWQNFIYQKDALGNITAIVDSGRRVVCRYFYTAFGETTIHRADGRELTGQDLVGFIAQNPIATENPFRWKSHYWDQIGIGSNPSNGYYYLDGRYYDPTICGYVSADNPENLLLNAFIVHGLNRYAISTTNPVALLAMLHTIFTTIPLSWDTTYPREFSWWDRAMMWLHNAAPWIRWGIIGIGIIVFIAAAIISKGTLIPAMLIAAAGGAMTGMVISAYIASLVGRGIADVVEGAAWGALTGAAMAVAVAGVVGGVKYVKAKNFLVASGQTKEQAHRAIKAFKGMPTLTKSKQNIVAHRYWDGINAFEKGRWLTPHQYADPINSLGLHNNLATNMSTFMIPKGTKFLQGTVAKTSTQLGGGFQFYIRSSQILIPF